MATASAGAANGVDHEVVSHIMSANSHFEVLGKGLHRQSSDDEVKKAYRTMALKTHPDKNKHERAEEAFKRVHGAFQALETQDKRDLYHRRGGTGFTSPGDDPSPFGGRGGFTRATAFDFFDVFMAGMGGGGFGRRPTTMDDIIMMMLMRDMMGGGGQGFGGHGHFHAPDEDEDEYYDEEPESYYYDEEYEEREEEEEDEEDEEYDFLGQDVFGNLVCLACQTMIGRSELALNAHLESLRHTIHLEHYRRDKRAEKDDDDEEEEEDFEDAEPDDEDDDEQFDVKTAEGFMFNTKTKLFVCRTCDVQVPNRINMENHLAGKRHKQEMSREEGEMDDYYCKVCDLVCHGLKQMEEHTNGKRHAKAMANAKTPAAAPADNTKRHNGRT